MKWYVILGVVLLVTASSLSGYYFGKFTDTERVNEEIQERIENSQVTGFVDEELGIELTHPSDWKVEKTNLQDNDIHTDIVTLTLTSTDGSKLIYYKGTPRSEDSLPISWCDSTLPEGDDDTVFPCEFINSYEYKFARQMIFSDIESRNEVWDIAEPGSESGRYFVSRNSYFRYDLQSNSMAAQFDRVVGSLVIKSR